MNFLDAGRKGTYGSMMRRYALFTFVKILMLMDMENVKRSILWPRQLIRQ